MKWNLFLKSYLVYFSLGTVTGLSSLVARANLAETNPSSASATEIGLGDATEVGEIVEDALCEKAAWTKAKIESRSTPALLALLAQADTAQAALGDSESSIETIQAAEATLEEWIAIDLIRDVSSVLPEGHALTKFVFWCFERSVMKILRGPFWEPWLVHAMGEGVRDRTDLPVLVDWVGRNAVGNDPKSTTRFEHNGLEAKRIILSTIKLKKKDLRAVIEFYVGFGYTKLDKVNVFKLDVVSQ